MLAYRYICFAYISVCQEFLHNPRLSAGARYEINMPLQDNCRKYKGQEIILYPIYGYGWAKILAEGADKPCYPDIDKVGSFKILIDSFIEDSEKITGVIASVDRNHKLFGGMWVVAFVMLGPQETNFTDRTCGRYNLEFYEEKPIPPKYNGPGKIIFTGCGILAENEEFVEKRHENWDKQPDKTW